MPKLAALECMVACRTLPLPCHDLTPSLAIGERNVDSCECRLDLRGCLVQAIELRYLTQIKNGQLTAIIAIISVYSSLQMQLGEPSHILEIRIERMYNYLSISPGRSRIGRASSPRWILCAQQIFPINDPMSEALNERQRWFLARVGVGHRCHTDDVPAHAFHAHDCILDTQTSNTGCSHG